MTETPEPTQTETRTITLDYLDLALMDSGPYCLIRAGKDPADGELTLSIRSGGGAEDDLGALPALMLTELPYEQNPIIRELVALRAELGDIAQRPADVIARVAEALSMELPEVAP